MPDLIIERVFDAPRELVFEAFTDPDQLSQWFGPVGYHVPRESVTVDLRVGGVQRFEMVPDSPEMPVAGWSSGVFDEIVEPALLVMHEDLEGEAVAVFGASRITMRLEFHDEGGKTRLVLHQGPYADAILGDAREGWGSSFTKLDTLLSGQTAATG